MKNSKVILKYIITFMGLVLLFNLLLFLVSLFPSQLIQDNVLKSAEIMMEQGDFVNTGLLAFNENSTDGLIINEAYSINSQEPVKSYLLARKNYKEGITKIQLEDQLGQLYTYADNNIFSDGTVEGDNKYQIAKELFNLVNDKVEISQTYTRYYHGYLVLFRPLLLLFDITGIRLFMLIVFIIIFIWFSVFLQKKLGTKDLIIVDCLLITFGYFGLAQGLEVAPLFGVIMISSIILLMNIEKYSAQKMMLHLFVTGCVTNYIDYLTSSVLSLFLPLFILYLYNNQNNNKYELCSKDFVGEIIQIFKFGLIWSCGYLLTLISKIVLVDVILQAGAISSMLGQLAFRTGGEIDFFETRIIESAKFLLRTILTSIIMVPLVLAIFDKFKIRKIDGNMLATNLNIVLLGIVPLAWMVLFFNHTIYHFDLFPYRNFMAPLMVLFCLLFADKQSKDKKKKANK